MKKNKKSLIPAVIVCALALFAVIGIRSFLGPCVHEDGTFGPCHKAGQALFWVSIVLLAEGVLAVLVNKSGVRKGLFIAILLTGVIGILIPGTFIDLCGMATMRCRAVMRPAMSMLFGAMSAFALIGFALSGEKS